MTAIQEIAPPDIDRIIQEALNSPGTTSDEEATRVNVGLPLQDWQDWEKEFSYELPASFGLGTLRDGRLRVLEAIQVRHLSEDDQDVMEATELNEFGFGDTPTKAMVDLQASLVDLFFALEAEQDRLGPDLASVWATLSGKVRRADAAQSA